MKIEENSFLENYVPAQKQLRNGTEAMLDKQSCPCRMRSKELRISQLGSDSG